MVLTSSGWERLVAAAPNLTYLDMSDVSLAPTRAGATDAEPMFTASKLVSALSAATGWSTGMKTLLLPVYAEEPGTWTGQCALTSAELSQLLGYLPALTLLQVRLLELQTVGCEEDPMAGVDEMEGGMAPADGAVLQGVFAAAGWTDAAASRLTLLIRAKQKVGHLANRQAKYKRIPIAAAPDEDEEAAAAAGGAGEAAPCKLYIYMDCHVQLILDVPQFAMRSKVYFEMCPPWWRHVKAAIPSAEDDGDDDGDDDSETTPEFPMRGAVGGPGTSHGVARTVAAFGKLQSRAPSAPAGFSRLFGKAEDVDAEEQRVISMEALGGLEDLGQV